MPFVHMYLTDATVEAARQGAVKDFFALLPGREIVRSRLLGGDCTIVTMDMPDAPPTAVAMVPWINVHDDGSIALGGIDYSDAKWHRLVREG